MELSPAVNLPEGGNQKIVSFNNKPKRYANIKPSQKTGIEIPILARTIVPTSMEVLCFKAEIIPKKTPTMIATTSPPKASSIVTGNLSTKICVTGRLNLIEFPKSPTITLLEYKKNCVEIGLSRPNLLSNFSHTSTVAFSPNIALQGSPGMSLASTNVTKSIPNNTGMDINSLLMM